MSRNPKPVEVNRKHLTKAEIETRKQWEEALKCDTEMIAENDIKSDRSAYAEFVRIKAMFAEVGMDDAFYASGVNRYCRLKCIDLPKQYAEREEIADAGVVENAAALAKKDSAIAKINDQLQIWEKENLFTVVSKLRAIPKKPADDEADNVTGIEAFMKRRNRDV